VETLDQYDRDESITVTTSETTIFEIDSRRILDSLISFDNQGPTNSIVYKIYGSAKNAAVAPTFDDGSFFNILNVGIGVTPANYDHNLSVTLPIDTPWYESFSNQWAWVIIRASANVASVTLQMWHRGVK